MEDHLGNLPVEISLEIFSYLSADELISARQVNRRWKDIINTDFLWKNLCTNLNIEDYVPSATYEEALFDHLCFYAKKYFCYESTLRSNWISGKTHSLHELNCTTRQTVTCWKRMFVKTTDSTHTHEIFKVDSQCIVHRIQTIDTSFRLRSTSSYNIELNDNWLAIRRNNILLLFHFNDDQIFELKWVILITDFSPLDNYLYVTKDTAVKDLETFICRLIKPCMPVFCKCLFPTFVWLLRKIDILVLQLSPAKKKVFLIRTLIYPFTPGVCGNKFGVVVYGNHSIKIYKSNAYSIFSFSSRRYLSNIVQSELTVGAIETTRPSVRDYEMFSAVVLIDCQNFKILKLRDYHPVHIALHPTKHFTFVIVGIPFVVRGNSNIPSVGIKQYKLCCYSSRTGHLLWLTEKDCLPFFSNPDAYKMHINAKFVDLTSTTLLSHEELLFDCNTGKVLRNYKDCNPSLSDNFMWISDTFIIYRIYSGERLLTYVECFL